MVFEDYFMNCTDGVFEGGSFDVIILMSEKEEDKIQQLVDVTQRTSSLTAFSHSVFTEEGLISSEGRSLTVDSDYFELEREIEQLKNARQFREGRKEELFRKEGRLLIEAISAEIKVS